MHEFAMGKDDSDRCEAKTEHAMRPSKSSKERQMFAIIDSIVMII